jgi:nucleoside permease NupC
MKDQLNNDLFCLPSLQEIVASVATVNIMTPHPVPKKKAEHKHSHVIAIYLPALANLASITIIGSSLFVLCHPRRPRQVGMEKSQRKIRDIFAKNFANVNAA